MSGVISVGYNKWTCMFNHGVGQYISYLCVGYITDNIKMGSGMWHPSVIVCEWKLDND